MNIGFVGYSGAKFDEDEGLSLVFKAFTDLQDKYEGQDIKIVSGATMYGIPKIVYEVATTFGYKTVGVMCKRGYDKDSELFPCDEIYAIGENWGDESKLFIEKIDALYRIGGGPQSIKEVKMAKEKGIPVMEYELKKIE